MRTVGALCFIGRALRTVRYAEFVVPLVKAVQEQQALIGRFEERIRQFEIR